MGLPAHVMALRPLVSLSVLIVALLAGCSDGPPSGDVEAIPGFLNVEGSTVESTYTAESGGQANPLPQGPPKLCPPEGVTAIPPCVDPMSHYKFHFMSLPDPSGDGYSIFQVGGTIGEKSLVNLIRGDGDMWEAESTEDEDQSAMFESFELRLGTNFVVATASSAAGSQAFVANPVLAGVTVTASYKGKTIDVDVQGLPEGGEFVGRLYKAGTSGNLTAVESFPIVAGAQSYTSKEANIGSYDEFHIHVGSSKIYVYQGTI